MSTAKPDYQAGLESFSILLTTYLGKSDFVLNHAANLHSYQVASFEKFVLDEEDPYTFYPQVEINGEWVSAGYAVRVDNTEMSIGKGVFNGSINLLNLVNT